MTDRELLGEPIPHPNRRVAAVIGGLLGLHTDAVVNLLAVDPPHGSVLLVIRDGVRARTRDKRRYTQDRGRYSQPITHLPGWTEAA